MKLGRSLRLASAALIAAACIGANAVPDALPAVTPHPAIAALVGAVSADRLKTTDDSLVAFGTRNDFSETSSTATHGVFAARDWIASQFRAIVAASGGRMSVALDTYVQAK